jgi:SAM-dependent methyltransferase
MNHAKTVREHVRRGVLVDPQTRQPLRVGGYPTAVGVPLLVSDREAITLYARESAKMNREYQKAPRPGLLRRLWQRDYRTPESIAAALSIFEGLPEDAVCIAIGGGPTRADDRLVNVNIGPFPNVDVVGDAHELPYADSSVDAIHCEAVFEHLHSPHLAAREVFRVLKPGGRAYVCTPFLQAYHGYPHHYQNFTLTGQVNLFERAGLRVVESGVCVGPTYTLRHMGMTYLNHAPVPLRQVLKALWAAVSLVMAPLDVVVRRRSDAHVMASTTYLVAVRA